MARDKDFRSWNRVDWWKWKVENMNRVLSGKEQRKQAIKDAMDFKIVYDYVEKTNLCIGAKVQYDFFGKTVIGFIEEPLLLGGKIVSNIERNRFSGQNSMGNYIVKYAPLDEVKLLEVDERECT